MKIRAIQESDIASILEIYRPFVTDSAASFEIEPPSLENFSQRVLQIKKNYPWLVAEQNSQVMGYAYGTQHRIRAAYQWSVEVSVYVNSEFHRRGVARSLYEQLFKELRAQGKVNAFAGTTLPNPASVTFHQSMGFREIGVFEGIGKKFGKWWDVAWFQRRL